VSVHLMTKTPNVGVSSSLTLQGGNMALRVRGGGNMPHRVRRGKHELARLG